jgi:type IV secretory pathway VirB2 component (pilin)/cell division protein FtsB
LIDILLGVIGFLFWPALLVGILVLLGRKRRKAFARVEQDVAAMSDNAKRLARRVEDLETRVARLESHGVAAQAAPATGIEPAGAAAALAEIAPVERPVAVPGAEVTTARHAAPAPVLDRQRPSAFARRRQALERQFIENWTGILGVVVVVAGVTFVGIYTALRLEPFFRFLLTIAAAAVFIGASLVLGRKADWQAFAGWLRSGGAAILLFACAAAGGLPGLGLQWITAPLPALALLLAGIAVNLYLAYASRTEVVATLHVLLSLLPLAIVPATTTALTIASAVALCGVLIAARGGWDRHLAIVLGASAIFHAVWRVRMGDLLGSDIAGYIAAGCAALVLCTAVLAHYRRTRAVAASPPRLQVGTHLASWGLLGLAMFVYVPSALVRGGVLVALAAFAYRLGQRARVLNSAWLQRSDTLAAQALLLLSLASGLDLGASYTLVVLLALAETLAFRWTVPREQDALLDRILDALPLAAAILLAVSGLLDITTFDAPRLTLAALLLAGSALAVLGQRVLHAPVEGGPGAGSGRYPDDWLATPGAALGAIAGLLLVIALAAVADRPWLEAASLVAVGALLLAWKRLRRAGLQTGAMLALTSAHLMSWASLIAGRDWAPLALAQRLVPLVGLAALALWLAGGALLRRVAIVLLGVSIGLAAFLFLDPVSALIPAVAWLLLSLAALEIANRREAAEAFTVLGVGYGYLVAFLAAYALVVVQVPAYVGVVRARALIEIFAVAVFGYWWFFRPRAALESGRTWTLVHPLFVELILAGIAVTVVVELAPQWWAVAWAILALGLLSPASERLLDVRARIYSLVFYWVSIADMAVVMSTLEVPSPRWFDQPEFTSLVAIGLQVAYAAWANRRLVLQALETPAPVRVLGRVATRVAARRNLYLYYPLFAGIALFLYWRFDRSVLTLLWAAEAFVVFAMSAWLRENQFRYVALAGLGACLVRLVLVDMAEANLALRGVVFIGVGLLMLAMNAIYNRYRTRFEA